METSQGIGVAVIVEPIAPGALDLPAGEALLRIDDVELTFNPGRAMTTSRS